MDSVDLTRLEVLIIVLGATRFTQLLMYDSILDRPRQWLVGWKAGRTFEPNRRQRFMGELLSCWWCTGFWVSVGCVVAVYQTDLALLVLAPFALSTAVAALMAALARL